MDRNEDAEAWFDDLAEGVVLIRAGRVARLNAAAAALLGVPAARAEGQPVLTVLRDHRLERVLREGRAEELRVRGRRVRAVPIRGGLALRDVEEAREAREQARDLLAVLSHELRTPLTTVRSTLEALDYDDLPDPVRRPLLTRATAEAERLVRLLNDLTVGVAPPRERSVPLREVAVRALAVLAPVLRERGVRVRDDLPELVAWVDPDKLLQVLINLIENAAVHGPANAEVVLAAKADGAWVDLTVRDGGRPLPAEQVEPLFAPHARGAGAGGRGTGLGLYVVRGIAERWNGRAWGRAWREGEGATAAGGNEFGVRVPLARDPSPPPTEGEAADG